MALKRYEGTDLNIISSDLDKLEGKWVDFMTGVCDVFYWISSNEKRFPFFSNLEIFSICRYVAYLVCLGGELLHKVWFISKEARSMIPNCEWGDNITFWKNFLHFRKISIPTFQKRSSWFEHNLSVLAMLIPNCRLIGSAWKSGRKSATHAMTVAETKILWTHYHLRKGTLAHISL